MVVVGCHFHEIDTDHVALRGEAREQFKSFVIQQTTVARGARARRDRRIETVDIDRQVITYALRDALQHTLDAEAPEVAYRNNVGAHLARLGVSLARGRRHVANADL